MAVLHAHRNLPGLMFKPKILSQHRVGDQIEYEICAKFGEGRNAKKAYLTVAARSTELALQQVQAWAMSHQLDQAADRAAFDAIVNPQKGKERYTRYELNQPESEFTFHEVDHTGRHIGHVAGAKINGTHVAASVRAAQEAITEAGQRARKAARRAAGEVVSSSDSSSGSEVDGVGLEARAHRLPGGIKAASARSKPAPKGGAKLSLKKADKKKEPDEARKKARAERRINRKPKATHSGSAPGAGPGSASSRSSKARSSSSSSDSETTDSSASDRKGVGKHRPREESSDSSESKSSASD